jgi:2-polyprenyl-3-methyl-5-hydroxy-6-metoxy-1,4-benzoquinol methylase
MLNLSRRHPQPEIMEQPDLDPMLHQGALRGLERINLWSGSAGILWPSIRNLAQRNGGHVSVLDIATGAGDLPIRLWRKAHRKGLSLDIAGCDIRARAVDHARQRAEQAGAGVRFFVWNALADPPPAPVDVATWSLFLHHLEDDEAVLLLSRMSRLARLVLVNDLVRSRTGYLLAYFGVRLLFTSWVVHHDGPVSVRAAFRPSEALELARRAGMNGATVARRWPCRFLLSWSADAPADRRTDFNPS